MFVFAFRVHRAHGTLNTANCHATAHTLTHTNNAQAQELPNMADDTNNSLPFLTDYSLYKLRQYL